MCIPCDKIFQMVIFYLVTLTLNFDLNLKTLTFAAI